MVQTTSRQVRFTVDEYLEMDRAGIFGDQRVELLRGRIHHKRPQANPHRWSVTKVSRLLHQFFAPDQYWVVVQGTLYLGKYGAPEPDFHVFDVPAGTDDELLPKPFVVIEASDTTYRKDTGTKLRLYASAGIGEYWIVNLLAHRLEIYRDPINTTGKVMGWTYQTMMHHSPTESVAFLGYPDVKIKVKDLLP